MTTNKGMNRELPSYLGWRRFKLIVYKVTRFWFLPLMRLVIGLKNPGVENIPRHGPAIVAANHLHNIDPIAIETAFDRPICFMAKKELFSVPIFGRVARACGAFPVDRGAADRGALREAERLLHQGMLVGLFPEGTRSTTGGLKEPFPGVALIALRTGAPIIPTAIIDSDSLPGNGKRGRRRKVLRAKVIVRIGKPFTLPELGASGRRLTAKEAVEIIMIEIAKLLPREYQGIYVEHPEVSPNQRKSANAQAISNSK